VGVRERKLFEEAFDQHYELIFRYLRGRTNSELASDLTAETFFIAEIAEALGIPDGRAVSRERLGSSSVITVNRSKSITTRVFQLSFRFLLRPGRSPLQ
jgi:DNA-directed RNA polymerase specialized sigma24 family protein